MSVITVVLAVFLPLVCISAAGVLMRLFAVKQATLEQATLEQATSEAEKLLTQVNREVVIRRRVRAGAPSNATLIEFQHNASLSKTRIRFPRA